MISPEQYAERLAKLFPKAAIKAVVSGGGERFYEYQSDPVGFAKDILKIDLTDDVQRMLESVRDNRITLARSATGTGKSHGASVAAIWFYKCFSDCQVRTVAHPFENQKILWGEINMMARKSGLFDADKVINFHIERNPVESITALSVPTSGDEAAKESKFSGKHQAHQLFIVDEGDTLPSFAYRGIEGCMSGEFERLLVLFNPRQQAGEIYQHERDGTAEVIHLSAFSHPNVITGHNIIPGAVSRRVTVDRIAKWTRPLHDDEKADPATCFELPDFLVGERSGDLPPLRPGWYKIQNPLFSYVVLGEYPTQAENQLISREWIDRARARWEAYVAQHGEIPPAGTMPIIGLDVADMGVDLNARCLRYGGYVPHLKTWGGVDPIVTGDRAIQEYRNASALRCCVDGNGVGAGVAPYMQRAGCTAVSVKVQSSPTRATELGEFRILRDQLYWEVREWLRTDPGAMLPPDERLIEELAVPTYRIHNGKIEVMQKDDMKELLHRSPDHMESLILTFYEGGLFAECSFSG